MNQLPLPCFRNPRPPGPARNPGPGRGPRGQRTIPILLLLLLGSGVGQAASASIAREWNEQILAAIRIDSPHPPVQARNLFSLSVCLYDAWAAYDPVSTGYVYHRKHAAADVTSARREALSIAAHRILRERYAYSRSASNTLAILDTKLAALGYSTNPAPAGSTGPAAVGEAVYQAVSAWFLHDGSRQAEGTPLEPYPDLPPGAGGYVYLNRPLPAGQPGIVVENVSRWQRLQIVNRIDQNGFPEGPIQTFQGAQWLGVRPFALTRTDPARPWIDPGPPPRFGGASHEAFVSNVVEVIRRGSELTPDDGVTLDISPGATGNNPLGTGDGTGHPLNPVTGQPYPPNRVRRGDFARVLAEYWADGPTSETPPGHWNVLANQVADHPLFQKRLTGTGPVVDDLEWDVKVYFALNAALHDAACAAWSLKRFYDGWRPLSAIRYLGLLGQRSNPTAPAYNTDGLPLIPGLIELVTPETVASGRHRELTPGRIAVRGWPGQPVFTSSRYQGVVWLHADAWVPFQRRSFVTPGFPGYVSGHSTFSRAAAEVLTAITGSAFFPGGLAGHRVPADAGLAFEKGPSETLELQWATYFDAADQAGLSRIWGGIHPPVDDFTGRRVGAECGRTAWALARTYFAGTVPSAAPGDLSLLRQPDGTLGVTCQSARAFHYQLQRATAVTGPYIEVPGTGILAEDTRLRFVVPPDGTQGFFRVVCLTAP